ncbi:MAG: citrate lyase subunit beta / citryl-CoA lyase [Nocardioides sp.]|jgi:citrate lyase subunit beta/citryl-CoA lyase|nr:citrate lyase subunit beta / citryl-CoA lyase [Nocardioides sp.]
MTSAGRPAPLRSLLFCPATEPRRLAKLPNLGADAVAVDLEDSVAESEKDAARAKAKEAVAGYGPVRTYVRVNDLSTGRTQGDIDGVTCAGLAGIVLPKVDDADMIRQADEWLTRAEEREGVAVGKTRVLVLLETGRGIHNAVPILSASPRVETAIFGFVDFMLDVGIDVIDHTPQAEELLYARSSVVIAARVAGTSPPLDGPFIDIGAPEAFEAQCRQARALGFRGKMLIHPSQVALSHTGFAPSAEEADAARRIVAAFAVAEQAGNAAVVVDGRLVDYPVVQRAQRIIEAAR